MLRYISADYNTGRLYVVLTAKEGYWLYVWFISLFWLRTWCCSVVGLPCQCNVTIDWLLSTVSISITLVLSLLSNSCHCQYREAAFWAECTSAHRLSTSRPS